MAKRIFQGVILFFAIYAFVFLPLGKKTALEHVRAIVATPAAREAASEVKGGVTRLVRRLESEARRATEDPDGKGDGPDPATGRDDIERGDIERGDIEPDDIGHEERKRDQDALRAPRELRAPASRVEAPAPERL